MKKKTNSNAYAYIAHKRLNHLQRSYRRIFLKTQSTNLQNITKSAK